MPVKQDSNMIEQIIVERFIGDRKVKVYKIKSKRWIWKNLM
ncbi:MAG: hypothetical protein JWQ09_1873 [Segetibacter sp.]|nr:hypothetical protein [Segetibacter sp.]